MKIVFCKVMIVLILVVMYFVLPTRADVSFVDNAGGARSLSLGRAFVADASDASATLFNPAGLSQLIRKTLVISANTITDYDVRTIDLFAAMDVSNRVALGIGVVSSSVSDIPSYTSYNQFIGNTDASQTCFVAAGSYDYSPLSIGVNFKYYNIELYPHNSSGTGDGVALGIGMLFQRSTKLLFGVQINRAYNISYQNQHKESIENEMSIGAKYTTMPGWERMRSGFTFYAQINQIKNQPMELRLGLEKCFSKRLAIRGGVDGASFETREISLGVLDYNKYNIRPSVGIGIVLPEAKWIYGVIDVVYQFRSLSNELILSITCEY